MSTTPERDLVCRLAVADWRRAYDRAVAIADPWLRAQARACVARYAPSPDVIRVAREALSDAEMATDAYRRVASKAWAIRALVERGYPVDAERAMAVAIGCASEIQNPVTRVDALFLIWQAVYPLGPEARNEVLNPLLRAALTADSWKPQRVLQSLIFMLPPGERLLADEIVQRMPPGKYRGATARRLAGVNVRSLADFSRPMLVERMGETVTQERLPGSALTAERQNSCAAPGWAGRLQPK